MRLDIFFHFGEADGVMARLDAILSALNGLTGKVDQMSAELDALKAAVTEEHTVIDSAITLLEGLSAQIETLKEDPAALAQLAADVRAKSAALADAVAANTPAAPPPVA